MISDRKDVPKPLKFTMQTSSSHSYIPLIGIILAITALRLMVLQLSPLDLHFDEAQYWYWSLEPAWGYFSKPPLIAWIIESFTRVCGEGAGCVRAAAPVLHGLTAMVLYSLGSVLYRDRQTSFWIALTYLTLPAVSWSSQLMTTDIPLLLCWALALLCFVKLTIRPVSGQGRWLYAIGLGLSIGCGLLAKYAMIYFPLSIAIFLIWQHFSIKSQPDSPHEIAPVSSQALLPTFVLAAVIAGLLILPNILWNMQAGWVTVSHTAANANWDGALLKPHKLGEFLLGQFGVFGPILMSFYIIALLSLFKRGPSRIERLLISFSLPVLLIVASQAFLSRAHANWAAVSYIAATILVVRWAISFGRRWVNTRSLILHSIIALLIMGYGSGLISGMPPRALDPFHTMRGWDDLSTAIDRQTAEQGAQTILTDDRKMFGSLYHLRTLDQQYYGIEKRAFFMAPSPDGQPHNHYQLKAALPADAALPILFVTRDKAMTNFSSDVKDSALFIETIDIHPGHDRIRRYHSFLLLTHPQGSQD